MNEPTARAPLPSRPTTAKRLDTLEDGLRTLAATVDGHITGHMAEHHRADGVLEGVMQTVDTLANALTVNGAQARQFNDYIAEARATRATREGLEAEQSAKIDLLLAWQAKTEAEQARVQAEARAAIEEDRRERKDQSARAIAWLRRLFGLLGAGLLALLPFYVSQLPPSWHALALAAIVLASVLGALVGAIYWLRGRG